jgi:hypothetical protein
MQRLEAVRNQEAESAQVRGPFQFQPDRFEVHPRSALERVGRLERIDECADIVELLRSVAGIQEEPALLKDHFAVAEPRRNDDLADIVVRSEEVGEERMCDFRRGSEDAGTHRTGSFDQRKCREPFLKGRMRPARLEFTRDKQSCLGNALTMAAEFGAIIHEEASRRLATGNVGEGNRGSGRARQ